MKHVRMKDAILVHFSHELSHILQKDKEFDYFFDCEEIVPQTHCDLKIKI